MLVLAVLAVAGCGGGPKVVREAKPTAPEGMKEVTGPGDYFSLPDSDENFVYGKGRGESVDFQVAQDKADMIAAANLGSNVERYVTANTWDRLQSRDLSQKVNANASTGEKLEKSFATARKQVVETCLRDIREHLNKVYQDSGQYVAYIVYKVPRGQVSSTAYDAIQQQQELFQMFKDSQVMKELEADAAKFRDLKATGKI